LGIEKEAGDAGYDMLLFTSATGPDGRRSIFGGGVNRLGLADGCVLLGRNENKDELARLADEGYPFVYIGRRELPGRRITYVTADYAAATADVVRRLADLGHRKIAYLGTDRPEEPDFDRLRGFESALGATGVSAAAAQPLRISSSDVKADVLRSIVSGGATALLVEAPEGAQTVFTAAADAGVDVPSQLSIAVLGDDPAGSNPAAGAEAWSGFRLPREEMGHQAVQLLLEVLETTQGEVENRVLPCVAVDGLTVAPPRGPQPNPRRSS
jgi:DNA-binding LacI/PurR family transcriptional regulator